jgi:proteasome subunit beta type
MEIGERPTVKVAANKICRLIYDYKDQLTAVIICAGWDKKNGGQVR